MPNISGSSVFLLFTDKQLGVTSLNQAQVNVLCILAGKHMAQEETGTPSKNMLVYNQ